MTASLKATERFLKYQNKVRHPVYASCRCEYHIVFAPRYRKTVIYRESRTKVKFHENFVKSRGVYPHYIHSIIAYECSMIGRHTQEQKWADTI